MTDDKMAIAGGRWACTQLFLDVRTCFFAEIGASEMSSVVCEVWSEFEQQVLILPQAYVT